MAIRLFFDWLEDRIPYPLAVVLWLSAFPTMGLLAEFVGDTSRGDCVGDF